MGRTAVLWHYLILLMQQSSGLGILGPSNGLKSLVRLLGGLLHDYEPSCEPSIQALVFSVTSTLSLTHPRSDVQIVQPVLEGNKFGVWTADPSPDQPRLKR